MDWLLLCLAGLFEIAFAGCLGMIRASAGPARYAWIAGFGASMVASLLLLNRALQSIPLGTAYAVWTGIGAAGTVLVGILVFRDPVSFWRLFFLTALIASIAGLKFVSS